jgi:predicted DNA-binding transcriptional regulator AlpA
MNQMAKATGKSKKTIQRAIKEMGFVHFEGPRKDGHWVISDNNNE